MTNTTTPAARVMLDDLGPYDAASIAGTCPNGYALPYFTLDTVRRLAADLDTARAQRGNGDTIAFDGTTVRIIDGDAGDDDADPVMEVCHPRADGTYALGHGYWTWHALPYPAEPGTVPDVVLTFLGDSMNCWSYDVTTPLDYYARAVLDGRADRTTTAEQLARQCAELDPRIYEWDLAVEVLHALAHGRVAYETVNGVPSDWVIFEPELGMREGGDVLPVLRDAFGGDFAAAARAVLARRLS
ncbi:hypothetical protein ACFV1L_35980 [Kitasatospora sp. NPDC059646]|uniref:hypothetical protein n=1 Tax=Kitasatospora sp. NPDC059646 TaxID=3346893 RepID=UPI003685AA98